MWRRHLTLGLLTVIAGIWFASWEAHTPYYSALKKYRGEAGEDYLDVVRSNLKQHLSNHHHLSVSEDQLQVAPLPSGLLSAGQRFLVVFSAIKEEGQHILPDIYVMQVSMGQNASPLSFTPPRNLTDNPLSHDRLFELKLSTESQGKRRGVQILFGQLNEAGACRSVSYLWWGESHASVEQEGNQKPNVLSSWLRSLEDEHYFDRESAPKWSVLRFTTPLSECSAKLGVRGDQQRGHDKFQVFSNQNLSATVDTITQGISPISSKMELIGSLRPVYQTLDSLQQTLRTYDLLNTDEDLSLISTRSRWVNSFERNLYELFVDESDPKQHRPVEDVSSILDGRRPTWYPPRIDVKSGFPNEGQWREVPLKKGGKPLLLKTFIRLDPEFPFHSIHLYAMDMRRLGLRFVGGGDVTDRRLEGVGSSRIKAEDQSRVIAAFSGGPSLMEVMGEGTATGANHGIIQDRQVLIPPVEGLSTIAIDQRGRVSLGRLDVRELPWGWSSLRQSYAPLVDLRVRDRTFVPPQSPKGRLDHLQLTRSAIGINQQGTLIFAWSEATTTQLIAQALKLVGVQFAMSLRSHPQQNGLALYPEARLGRRLGAERPIHKKMKVDPQVWRDGSAHDFFYLVLAQSMPKTFPNRPPTWDEGEGVWRPVEHQDIDPWLATSFVNEEHIGAHVELLRIDSERLRINLALGGHRDLQRFREERPLNAGPVSRFPIGFATNTLGVVSISKQERPPQLGKMTWAVDDRGHSVVGRWGQGDLSVDASWSDLIQGETLIDRGQPVAAPVTHVETVETQKGSQEQQALEVHAEAYTTGPMTAVGTLPSGDMIIAHVANANRTALQKAMIAAGVTSALRLNYRGTANTGRPQFFYRHQGQTFFNVYPDLALKPAFLQTEKSALISLEDSLIITPRRALPRARFLQSFRDLLNEGG